MKRLYPQTDGFLCTYCKAPFTYITNYTQRKPGQRKRRAKLDPKKDKNFSIDMTKAKAIHKDKIRLARAPKLAELDVEFQKAQETSADTTEIVSKKQALRDAPAASAIDSATTTDELVKQWDTAILGETPYQT